MVLLYLGGHKARYLYRRSNRLLCAGFVSPCGSSYARSHRVPFGALPRLGRHDFESLGFSLPRTFHAGRLPENRRRSSEDALRGPGEAVGFRHWGYKKKPPDRCPIRGDLTSSLRALASAGTGHFPEGETIGWNGNAAIAMKQSELNVLMHRNHRAVLLSSRERR